MKKKVDNFYSTYYSFLEDNGKVQLLTTLYVDQKEGAYTNDGIEFFDDFKIILDSMIESDGLNRNNKIVAMPQESKDYHLNLLNKMKKQIEKQIKMIEKLPDSLP